MKINEHNFLEIDITQDMMQRAQHKAAQLGQLKNSIRSGKGNLVGFLGEEIVLAAKADAVSCNEKSGKVAYNHDIIFEDSGITVEVKSKDRTVFPSPNYEASVADFNTRQETDCYVFTSIYRPDKNNPLLYTKGHILGFISKSDYYSKCKFWKKGDIDPSNGWVVSADCYNLPYFELSAWW